MNSITTRLLVSASLVLAGFVILTSLSVRHSVHKRAEQALFDRMQGMVYGILGAAELDKDNLLSVNEYELPDQRLISPVSGTYAEIRDGQGARLWSSKSSVANVPAVKALSVGQWKFVHEGENSGQEVRALQFATSWLTEEDQERIFSVQVVDNAAEFSAQMRKFDRNLWVSLLLSALLLLMVQLLVLSWGLNPLSKIGRGLKRIESGEDEVLDTRLPLELKPLANSINTLLGSERNRHLRYRNVMDDLAHSLKTPLSVLGNIQSSGGLDDGSRDLINEQTERMNDIIAYHLKRANAGGSQALAPPISPISALQRLCRSLKKVYPQNSPEFHFDLHEDFRLRVNESDLMEILGNLLENACKYGASRISVSGRNVTNQTLLCIDDNGPGFPDEHRQRLSERGRRADSTHEGQGLGLAVTLELVQSYGGEMTLDKSPDGGARVVLAFH